MVSRRPRFALFHVNGDIELAVGPLFDFGVVRPGAPSAARFRIRNTSGVPAAVNLLPIAAAGFSLPAPATPVRLSSQAALEFTVTFQAAGAGAYSASLDATGLSTLLLAAVPRVPLRRVNAEDAGHLAEGGE